MELVVKPGSSTARALANAARLDFLEVTASFAEALALREHAVVLCRRVLDEEESPRAGFPVWSDDPLAELTEVLLMLRALSREAQARRPVPALSAEDATRVAAWQAAFAREQELFARYQAGEIAWPWGPPARGE